MSSRENRFSLTNDRATALQLLRLQEAAELANNKLVSRGGFTRNDRLSHVVHASLNFSQFIFSSTETVFHHLHHAINRHLRELDQNVPNLPEERNPIFFVYPICMGISLFLCIFWLITRLFNRWPIIALLGNALGAILIMLGGISAMGHAEKHINLNQVSDEQLLTHPIFIHNFVICMLSIFGMILYLISTWILYDVYLLHKRNMKKKQFPSMPSRSKGSDKKIMEQRLCKCSHSSCGRHPHRLQTRMQDMSVERANQAHGKNFPSESNVQHNVKQDEVVEPVILYCCCVDCYRYFKSPQDKNNLIHEFQVIQIM